ncbi:uncharacterized protein LOC124812563 [Hydra vulgaris]|uniref:uncharacterized protein LOC124812563 n=1 Tax=Hydra vulgaris TaxID=6087 RepID=UPI001F5F315C|nr:uncharacterized protein LOC124812563 [Hydra vulgaris]
MRPQSQCLESFFKSHPVQPKEDGEHFPFSNVRRVFYRSQDDINRVWLSYCHSSKAMFRTVCLAYSKASESNAFTDGMNDWKHVHQRIEEHKSSKHHCRSVEAHMSSNDKDVYSLLFSNQKNVRAAQVKEKRQVLERVIEIVKFIGKRGLSYRSINDAAYCLDNVNIDHGNFLEILILLSKFDPLMKNHLDIVTEKSKQRHVTCAASGTKGRGGLVTFISSTTVNYVIEFVRRMIKASIADEIQSAGMFSVQLDTTQDVSVKDQCSIVIRYVKDHIYEQLVSVSNCTNSTGKGMFELFRDEIVKMGINIEKCVGTLQSGRQTCRANIPVSQNGSVKHPQVHVWCYAHVLNLVLVDTTETTKAAISIFQLINKCAVFLRESYIRMDIWASKQSNNRRLNVIGETRWWAKNHALKKIFGSFNNPSTSLYIELIKTLQELASSEDFNPTVRDTAQTLLDKCISFETILTVQVFLRIFQHTASLSKYLQTSGMDVL